MADRVPSEEIMGRRVTALERQVRELQQGGMVIPYADAHLSSVMPGNVVAYMDDRLIVRRPDGVHFDLRSATSPHIPVLTSDPASTSPCSVWILSSNGHLRVRTSALILDFTPNNAAAVTARSDLVASSVPVPAAGSIPTTRQTMYSSTWSGSYDGSNTRRETEHMYFGLDPADAFGSQKSMIGFNATTIAADLTGATIISVEVYLAIQSMPYVLEGDKGTVRIGLHNNDTRPESYTNIYKNFTNALSYGKTEDGWRQITNEFATGIQGSVSKGIVIDQLTPDPFFYGWAAGANESSLPKVRITYVR